MRIKNLTVKNFRGINKVILQDLGDTIIVAGQNGSGKSCLFDAIRLLKSTYGGYQHNEWQHFFGEFQIQLHGPARNLSGLFNDPNKTIEIECTFELRGAERSYILSNAKELLEEVIWQRLLPEAFQWGGYRKAQFSAQFRDRQPEVTAKVEQLMPKLLEEIWAPEIRGGLYILGNGDIQIINSNILNLVFSSYRPRHIGVVDFHGAQRHYGRELIQGINLNLDQQNHNYSQHSLYNYNNKYNNVKSEMAGNYIKEILAEKANSGNDDISQSLSETLKGLFEVFFPDKVFLGPQPTPEGSLSFPVRTMSGSVHDLDELSSGEKEILYGYLRIRSSAPANSIILLDEPELHLNPRLIRGLPEFYRVHLGEKLGNQLWLVTHSDSLIREAIGKPGFNIFHMLPSGADHPDKSQLRPLAESADLDLVLADLVGDLAAYRPGGKGLLLEGGGDTDFDKTFVSKLFADELKGINLISGSNKSKVRALHDVLDNAYRSGDLPTKFYAITDKDTDENAIETKAVSKFQWDVYHIENYLIDFDVILEVVNASLDKGAFAKDKVIDELKKAALDVIPSVISHQLRSHVNSLILKSINLSFDPSRSDLSEAIFQAAEKSCGKIVSALENQASLSEIQAKEAELRAHFNNIFENEAWKYQLPGREILRRFISAVGLPFRYETFRNLILNRMTEKGIKPAGMAAVLDKIIKD